MRRWLADLVTCRCEPATTGETIVVEPVSADAVRAGPYYIELSGQEFDASSPFDLSVRTT